MEGIDPSKRLSDLRRDSLLIFFLGLGIFTAALDEEFISLQARFALFAQEMLRNGPSFFPTTYGIPYPDYPATSTFLIYLVSLPFGKVTPFTAVLPTAITSALILVVMYRIGTTRSRKWGWTAVLFALFTHLFLTESRSIALDQYNALATTLCFYLIYSADIYGKRKRLWFIALVLMASFSFRGPIGMIIPTGVVCAYYLCRGEFKKFLLMGVLALCLLSMCSAAILAAAYYDGGEAFANRVVSAQASGRMFSSRTNWYFYWYRCLASLSLAYPLAALIVIVRCKRILGRKDSNYEFMSYLVVWVLIVLAGMSIAGDKKMRYVLPIVPAVSLVASYLVINPSLEGLLLRTRNAFLGFCSLLPLLGGIAAIGILWLGRHFGFTANVHFAVAAAILGGLSVTAGPAKRRLTNDLSRDMATMAIAVAAFITICVGIAQPINLALETTQPFVARVKLLQKERPGDIVFYRIGPDGEDIKFMANYDEPPTPAFLISPEELLDSRQYSYFIAEKPDFDTLPADVKRRTKVRFQGKIGHKDCTVFTVEKVTTESLYGNLCSLNGSFGIGCGGDTE
jgi:4-amino-4-deoxy-L-arabinose transferase-like glycosyltransferase